MRSGLIAALVTIGFATASQEFMREPKSLQADLDNVSCLMYDDMTVFNIKVLESPTGYSKDGYSFNFCKRMNISSVQHAGEFKETFVYEEVDQTTNPPRGQPLTKGLYPDATDAVDEVAVEDKVELRHLKYRFNSEKICVDKTFEDDIMWKAEFEIFCDSNIKGALTSNDFTIERDVNQCTVKISTRHEAGCPIFEATSIIEFFNSNPWLLAIILIVVGFLSNFYGGKLFNTVFAIVAGVFTFIVAILLCSVFGGLKAIDHPAQRNAGMILLACFCFALSTGLGILIGFLTTRFKPFGISLLGAFGGFIIGWWIYIILFSKIYESSTFAFVVSISCAVATAGYTFFNSETLGVPMTAIVGSFMIIRGFSLFIGEFPTEVPEIYQHEEIITKSRATIYYACAYVILLCAGVGFQRYKKYHLEFASGLGGRSYDSIQAIIEEEDEKFKKVTNAIN